MIIVPPLKKVVVFLEKRKNKENYFHFIFYK
jgi:hypothetical protein